MKSVRLSLVVALVLGMYSAVASQEASAAAPTKNTVQATTSELPAALAALSPDRSKILTSSAAQQIRGEGGKGKGHGKSHGQGYGKGGVHSNFNFGVIGGHTVIINIINSKNVRIGSHNHVKFSKK